MRNIGWYLCIVIGLFKRFGYDYEVIIIMFVFVKWLS